MNSTRDLFQRIQQQETAACDFGFYWESLDQLLEQIQSECREVKQAWLKQDKTNLVEEVGDLINATLSLAIFLQLDPNQTLLESVEKFQKRYDCLKKLVVQDGLADLRGKNLEVLLEYWEKAKQEILKK